MTFTWRVLLVSVSFSKLGGIIIIASVGFVCLDNFRRAYDSQPAGTTVYSFHDIIVYYCNHFSFLFRQRWFIIISDDGNLLICRRLFV